MNLIDLVIALAQEYLTVDRGTGTLPRITLKHLWAGVYCAQMQDVSYFFSRCSGGFRKLFLFSRERCAQIPEIVLYWAMREVGSKLHRLPDPKIRLINMLVNRLAIRDQTDKNRYYT